MSRSRKGGQRTRRQSGSRSLRARNKRAPGRKPRRRKSVDPVQRKMRNRMILLIAVLGLVNVYAFSDSEATLSALGSLRSASIGGRKGPLPPLAEPREQACGGEPVRIFEGLDDLLMLEGSLTQGYTLRLALLQLGVSAQQIDRIENAIRGTFNLGLLGGSGAALRVATDRHGTVHALEVELAEGHVLQACRERGDFEVRNLQHPLRSEVDVVRLELGRNADLVSAVTEAGEKPELAAALAEVLAADFDFMVDARPGDRIEAMIEKRWLGQGFHRYGAVLAVRLRAAQAQVSYYRYKPRGAKLDYFDGDGQSMRRDRLRSPVGFYMVNPDARGLLPPTVEIVEGRLGAVFRLPEGAPIVAVGDGKIAASSKTVEQGNVLDVELEDGTIVRYAHLMRTIGELRVGTPVRQGDVVALAGHSGRTPNDRVRVEIWRDVDGEMKTIDPIEFFAQSKDEDSRIGEPIAADQLDRFKREIEGWNKAMRRS